MAFFLLVYDQHTGRVLRLSEFPDSDRGAALEARFELERMHRLEPNIEIVLLGARDEATLRQTHSRYFKTVGELVANG